MVIGGQAEVEADGLGVADVEVAVGLRRKARHHPAVIFPAFHIFTNNMVNKVSCRRRISGGHRERSPQVVLPCGYL